MNADDKPLGTLSGALNHYALLKHDADRMAAFASQHADSPLQTCFTRSAVLLYVVSLEALINRVIEDFWPASSTRAKGDVKQWPTADKWHKVPLEICGKTFDRGTVPFQYLKALIDLRNDFVHAKPDTFRVIWEYRHDHVNNRKQLSPSPKQPKYPHIGLFKAPSEWIPQDAETVKRATEELVAGLASLLSNKITNQWLTSDVLESSHGQRITVTRRFDPEEKSNKMPGHIP